MAYAILRTAKLKTFGNIGGSLAHTYRTIHTPNADPSQTVNNEHDLSDPDLVMAEVKNRLPEKYRSDAVLCIEHLITASPEWHGWGQDEEKKFFEHARKWLNDNYGSQNVVSCSIHRDETTPHLIAYVVPIDAKTGRLNAKKWLGGRSKMSKMQTDFAKDLKKMGLERGVEGSKAEHTTIKQYYSDLIHTAEADTPAFQDRPELPKKSMFTESAYEYGNRVMDVVYEHVDQDIKRVQKENVRLKKQVHDLQQEVGRLRYFERKNKPYSDYCRLFPDQAIDLDSKFREATQNELERRERLKLEREQDKIRKEAEKKAEQERIALERQQPRVRPTYSDDEPSPKKKKNNDFEM